MFMEAILEQLIADFHERDLPAFTRRHIQLPWLSNKIRQDMVSFPGHIGFTFNAIPEGIHTLSKFRR